jgi:hypothetical protein
MIFLSSRRVPVAPSRLFVLAQAAVVACACGSSPDTGVAPGVSGSSGGNSSTGGTSSSGGSSSSSGTSSSGSNSSSGGTSSSGSPADDGGSADGGATDASAVDAGGPPSDASAYHSRYTFSVSGTKTYLNGQELLGKGFRTSNALISDQTANDLIANLDSYVSYGINMVSVYLMGSRYGNVQGYLQDASLDPVHADRLGRIIEAADARGLVVLVGCLYWDSGGNWPGWTQQDADNAIANTTNWAKSHNYRNVFFDPDNEGMAIQSSKYIKNEAELVQSGKNGDPNAVMANNYGPCPAAADLCIHISQKDPTKPYIQTEGGGIWVYGSGNYNPAAIGVYTAAQEQSIINSSQGAYKGGEGWMLASMWLQAPPPSGPNAAFGGDGVTKPGVAWWVDWLKSQYGAYVPPPPSP